MPPSDSSPTDLPFLLGGRAINPLSILVNGQDLNLTCAGTDDEIAFELTACRRALPPLLDQLDQLGDELGALEHAGCL